MDGSHASLSFTLSLLSHHINTNEKDCSVRFNLFLQRNIDIQNHFLPSGRYSREEYRCESCPYSCTTEKAFLKHVRQCAGKDTDLQNSPLSCPVCGKDRKNESSLSVHMVKHKSGKHFCCDLCKFKSIQLKKVTRSHK